MTTKPQATQSIPSERFLQLIEGVEGGDRVFLYISEGRPEVFHHPRVLAALEQAKKQGVEVLAISGPVLLRDSDGRCPVLELRKQGLLTDLRCRPARGDERFFTAIEKKAGGVYYHTEEAHEAGVPGGRPADFGKVSEEQLAALGAGARDFFLSCWEELGDQGAVEPVVVSQGELAAIRTEAERRQLQWQRLRRPTLVSLLKAGRAVAS